MGLNSVAALSHFGVRVCFVDLLVGFRIAGSAI
jgi:hypothetical protein